MYFKLNNENENENQPTTKSCNCFSYKNQNSDLEKLSFVFYNGGKYSKTSQNKNRVMYFRIQIVRLCST